MEVPFEQLLVINLEPTNFCNLHCEHCGDDKTRRTGYMSLDLAESILSQCLPYQEVRLFVSGEPLFHPRLDGLISAARLHVNKVVIHTNATRLDARMSERLIASGLTHLSISFDGLDAAEYQGIRRGARFDEVRDNISAWLRLNGGRVHTTVRRIIGAGQEAESLESLFPTADAHMVIPRHSWDVRGKIQGTIAQPFDVPCVFLNSYLPILWDGRVALCCADLNGRCIVGDARVDSLRTIWNGPAMRDIRSRQAKHAPIPEICSGCERYPY